MNLIIRPSSPLRRKYPAIEIKDFSLEEDFSNSIAWRSIEEIDLDEREKITRNGLEFLCNLGILIFDSGNFKIHKKISTLRNSNVRLGFLLGLLAEGLIVRECCNSQVTNRKFASVARRIVSTNKEENSKHYQLLVEDNIDEYMPVGTGFATTSTDPSLKAYHNPFSKRDILWIKKDELSSRELLIDFRQLNKKISIHAGLQIKTSFRRKGEYFKQLLRSNLWPDYPLIYFDLGDDFNIVKDNIFNVLTEDKLEINPCFNIERINQTDIVVTNSIPRFTVIRGALPEETKTIIRDFDLEYHLVRGKDISPEIHDQLLYYKKLLEAIFQDKTNIEYLDVESLQVLDMAFSLNFAFNSTCENTSRSNRINYPIIQI